MSDMIHAENLTFRYTDFSRATHLALDGVNLTIPYGQFAAILGRNGSGKIHVCPHVQRHQSAVRRQNLGGWNGYHG